jgi:hypothetical protein
MLDASRTNLLTQLTQNKDDLTQRYMDTASTNVSQAYGSARANQDRDLWMKGINPNSGAAANNDLVSFQTQAAQDAAARTQAARQAENDAISRQSQAANFQAGIPLPTYQTTGTVNPSTVTSAMSGSGSTAGTAANNLNNNAQTAFTGASTALNSLYWNPVTTNYMNSLSSKMGNA